MNPVAIIWLLFVGGLAAVIAEMFVPGAVMGIIGLMCVFGAIIYAIAIGETLHAAIIVVCTILSIPVLFVMWRNVIGRLFALKGDEGTYVPPTRVTAELVGMEGTALTTLRPSGTVRIDGKKYDVVTRGEMIDRGTLITVLSVSGNRVVVCETKHGDEE